MVKPWIINTVTVTPGQDVIDANMSFLKLKIGIAFRYLFKSYHFLRSWK